VELDAYPRCGRSAKAVSNFLMLSFIKLWFFVISYLIAHKVIFFHLRAGVILCRHRHLKDLGLSWYRDSA
jgi:hypothetical protein